MNNPVNQLRYSLSIDPEDWGINSNGENPAETTQGFNDAVQYAAQQSLSHVYIPKGDYLIDAVSKFGRLPEFGGGIRIPSNMEIEMHPEARFRVLPNSSQGYSCFYVGKAENVKISGGKIIGDRDLHDYTVPEGSLKKTHEWGFGIHIHGSRNVLIEHVHISDCIGDNIWIAADGMMNWSGTYTPAKSVTVKKCVLARGRRNNLATNGCEGLLVEDNDIEEAGGAEIGPQLGIDLEGYGDKGIKYDHPYELRIVGNRFRNNGRGAFRAHTSGKVIVEGNFSDDVFSYGYSTDVLIKGNHIINESGRLKDYGIDSIGVSSTETGNRVNISGNTIRGFRTGICARGKGVIVTENTLEEITSVAIHAYQCEDVLITGNRIDGNCIHFQVQLGLDVTISNNKSKGSSDKYTIKLMDSDTVSLSNNKTRGYGGLYCERSTGVQAMRNDFTLTASGYGVFWEKQSEVHLEGNIIRNAQNTAILGYADRYISFIRDNRIIDCKAIIALHLIGGRAHSIFGNTLLFNRTKDQGYGVYLDGTDGTRLIQNEIHSVSDKKLTYSFYTEKANSSELIYNTYSCGVVKTAENDLLIEYTRR
ncbi:MULTISPECIES: right-handed parallel beta-helix repeat-containing protein [Bacillus]|uniref:right-handed parallel beta-helix repeat-containing protein n=1 Tax=Bacillus TaxID=1386 RepID=UPI001BA612FF|nr:MULTISPECIES: right-handed parallel beta-helix repeat-containing protein [Bacillus]MCR9040933.1 right-handed parallel beta-helix repeat-containing protein [Bacillus velezensis]QUN07982.1 right-handed parallel beta-helix repeat-containing protein [Bacillus amyloliquefaciens]QYM81048.1 right-handed parallel beta-helix repeat-containing protein [Bacillus sp. 7D3]QZY10195.1 right-handed parallel beta-helix repeat-containing protein [Bacillus amyloliquefaciens]QZY11105.1 right-handed parallel be